MIKQVDVTARWGTDKLMRELFKMKKKSLKKGGEIGVEMMREELANRAQNETGETADSLMWAMKDGNSSVGGMARSDEVITPPKSEHQVYVGSAHGAGRITKGGKRISIITSIEYGTKNNTKGLGFIRATAKNNRLASKFIEEYKKDVAEASKKDYV